MGGNSSHTGGLSTSRDLVHQPGIFKRPSRTMVGAASWMLGVSIALFFIPIFGSIIGGFVGGYKLGVVRKAVLASIVPSVLVATGLWLLLAAFDLPILGIFTGLSLGFAVALADLSVIAGAILGALSGQAPDTPLAE